MRRITVAIDDELAEEIDRFAVRNGYQNRSEALRDLSRWGLREAAEKAAPDGDCVGALVYVYDHESRDLSNRLTRTFHAHHDLSVSAMHVHLDHGACLELNVLRGPCGDIRALAAQIVAERGVRYGRLIEVPAELHDEVHSHHNGTRLNHLHTHIGKTG
jgi:CopG family transcriptional regulator, nickel-responsive regulator